MKSFTAALALLLASAPASAQLVEVGGGDWSSVPTIKARGEQIMGARTAERIDQLARDRVCAFPGFSPRGIDLKVPFVVQFGQDGSVQRLVLANLGCPQLESLLGGMLLKHAQTGEYRPTGENQTGWYRSEFAFSVR